MSVSNLLQVQLIFKRLKETGRNSIEIEVLKNHQRIISEETYAYLNQVGEIEHPYDFDTAPFYTIAYTVYSIIGEDLKGELLDGLNILQQVSDTDSHMIIHSFNLSQANL